MKNIGQSLVYFDDQNLNSLCSCHRYIKALQLALADRVPIVLQKGRF